CSPAVGFRFGKVSARRVARAMIRSEYRRASRRSEAGQSGAAMRRFQFPTYPALSVIPLIASLFVLPAHAEIDGHGPDAWRVTGVAAQDTLNARMGPGTSYPVIETFAQDERGMV